MHLVPQCERQPARRRVAQRVVLLAINQFLLKHSDTDRRETHPKVTLEVDDNEGITKRSASQVQLPPQRTRRRSGFPGAGSTSASQLAAPRTGELHVHVPSKVQIVPEPLFEEAQPRVGGFPELSGRSPE